MRKLEPNEIAQIFASQGNTEPVPLLESERPPKAPHAQCWKCPLYANKMAPTCGDPNSPVAFVSRSPGQYDVMVGKPFANPRGAGAVLDHLLGRYRIKREDVLTTNVVLCRSDDPPKEAIAACRPRLDDDIKDCKLVIAGGTEATAALTRYRAVFTGRPFIHSRTSISGVQQKVIVTNNPAIVVRDSDKYPDMVEDFRRAFDPPPPPILPTYRVTENVDEAKNWITEILADNREFIACDAEWRGNELHALSFSFSGDRGIVLGRGVLQDENFMQNHLKPLFEYEDVPDGPYIEVELSKGYKAKISPEKKEKVSQYSWHIFEGSIGKLYAVSGEGIYMHRLLAGAYGTDYEVDHRNNDGLDNRDGNLRLCTHSQNHAAKNKVVGGTYKGIRRSKAVTPRWEAHIKVDGSFKHLGTFGSEIEAAKAYDLAARTHFGEFANLNFPYRKLQFIFHNGKADTKVLRANDINARIDQDTFIMSYALDERPGYHALEYLLSAKLAWPDYEPKSVKHFKKTGEYLGKTEQERLLSKKELYKYNCFDTAGTYQLFELLNPKLDTDTGGSVRPLYERLLTAATRFRTVEENGFNFDVDEACNINEREAIPRMVELIEHEREITGHALLNPNSPDQLKAILYGEWDLKHSLRDTGKRKLSQSTGKEVREIIELGDFTCGPNNREKITHWASTHKQYKKIQDLRSRYLEGLAIKTLIDGKLYCIFNPCGTVSGRTSSNDPNFQNIAREGYEEIPGIRTLFLPSEGNVIISADFSQAELRTCAKLSGDANLLAIYRDSSRSLHKERAASFYGDNYTYEEYVKCFHPDTEVLTPDGWLKITEVTTDTTVMQAIPGNAGSLELEWTKPIDAFSEHADKLIHLKNEGIDLRVTPTHRMVGWTTDTGAPKIFMPHQLGLARRWPNAGWLRSGKSVDEAFLRLAIAIQADGSIRENGQITSGFSKQSKSDRLEELLAAADIKYTLTTPQNLYRFYIPLQENLDKVLDHLDDDKTLSWDMLLLDYQSRKIIIDELQYWDATKDQPRWKMFVYHSFKKKNIDIAQALATSIGKKSRIEPSLGESLSIKDHHTTRGGNLWALPIDYDGEVYCLTVPSSFLVVRDRGIVVIAGNSKNQNFGITYGQSANAFQQMYHIPIEESEAYIASWWTEFPDLLEWTKYEKAKAKKDGLVVSPFGHKRRFHLITDENIGDVEREAVNFKPQNIAAWLTISALCDLVDLGVRVVATVHDSIVVDAARIESSEVAKIMREVMESQAEKQLGWTNDDVPFLADVSIGENWGSLDEIELERIAT